MTLKPLSTCGCPWLQVKTKIIAFQSDVYFSFRKSHHPKKLSKRSLTILYLENYSALSFAFESPNDLNWFFDWSASSAFICLHSYKLVTSFPNLETDMFFYWIIFKGTRQAAFLTILKSNGDFTLSFFKIHWMTELQFCNKFFFWIPSGFAELRVGRDEVGSLMDKIGSRVSFFILIAKSDVCPLASSTLDLCKIILSNLE